MTTGSFHTQWRWYFQDDVGQWILFDKVGDDIESTEYLISNVFLIFFFDKRTCYRDICADGPEYLVMRVSWYEGVLNV